MTGTEFRSWCTRRVRLLDGATGSNLRAAGMPAGVCAETWILEHPQPLQALQRAYAAAGSEIVLAPTFGANRALLGSHGLEACVTDYNRRLVALTREAVGGSALIAGDMTTTGQPVPPDDDAAYARLLDIYTEQAAAVLDAGVDLFFVETMMGLTECMAAVEAIRALTDTAIVCTMSVQSDGRCYFDGSVYDAAQTLPELGADAVGVNCSSGPDQLESVVRMVCAETSVPVVAKPNAGLPEIRDDGTAVYDMTPEAFAARMTALVSCGAKLVGGCCGTTPEHIRALHDAIR